MRPAIFCLLCLVGSAYPTRVECVLIPLGNPARSAYAAIFLGTVREVTSVHGGQIATFAVDRVWKGEITRTYTIYKEQGVEALTFERGKAYLVSARPTVSAGGLSTIAGC